MKIQTPQLPTSVASQLKSIGRYRVILFALFVVALYGYLVFQVGQASSVQPDASSEVTVSKPTPRIDPQVVEKLEQLQDNSVSVKALFNGARTNPFQ